MEDLFHQYRNGLLDEDRHTALINIAKRRLRYPGVRAACMFARNDHGSEYQKFIEDLMQEVPVSSPISIAEN